jgi:hypothetical protein
VEGQVQEEVGGLVQDEVEGQVQEGVEGQVQEEVEGQVQEEVEGQVQEGLDLRERYKKRCIDRHKEGVEGLVRKRVGGGGGVRDMVKSSGGLFPALEKKSTLKGSPSTELRQQKRTDYWAEERLTQLSTVYLLEEIFIEKNPGTCVAI